MAKKKKKKAEPREISLPSKVLQALADACRDLQQAMKARGLTPEEARRLLEGFMEDYDMEAMADIFPDPALAPLKFGRDEEE